MQLRYCNVRHLGTAWRVENFQIGEGDRTLKYKIKIIFSEGQVTPIKCSDFEKFDYTGQISVSFLVGSSYKIIRNLRKRVQFEKEPYKEFPWTTKFCTINRIIANSLIIERIFTKSTESKQIDA